MANNEALKKLRDETHQELETNILPYWMKNVVDPKGGFYGEINGKGEVVPNAIKGGVLNARILWTFSAAYRIFKKKEYLDTATRAKREIIDKFYDKKNGGTYWTIDCDGKPVDAKKQIYQLGFSIYGLSEYNRATGDEEAKEYAIKLFHDIENHSFDKEKNGYIEAFAQDWSDLNDVRLSDKEDNSPKTMNTHLHILEPYTNLYRIWKDPIIEQKLRNLIDLFCDKILMKNYHLGLFFDNDLNCNSPIFSFGHDIEAAWLMDEAAQVLGDKAVIDKVLKIIHHVTDEACRGLLGAEAGMIHELNAKTGELDAHREWWPQCEAIIGCLNAYQRFGDKKYLDRSIEVWTFVKNHLIDHEHGEWYWGLRANGTLMLDDDKIGLWKCPYHNSRMCMEVYERAKEMGV